MNSLGDFRHFLHYEVSVSSLSRNVICCPMELGSYHILRK